MKKNIKCYKMHITVCAKQGFYVNNSFKCKTAPVWNVSFHLTMEDHICRAYLLYLIIFIYLYIHILTDQPGPGIITLNLPKRSVEFRHLSFGKIFADPGWHCGVPERGVQISRLLTSINSQLTYLRALNNNKRAV